MLGVSQRALQRYMIGSDRRWRWWHCTSKRYGWEGCHEIFLMGECWINTATGICGWRGDQIQIVEWWESFFVANRVLTGFHSIVDIPLFRCWDASVVIGGQVGCWGWM